MRSVIKPPYMKRLAEQLCELPMLVEIFLVLTGHIHKIKQCDAKNIKANLMRGLVVCGDGESLPKPRKSEVMAKLLGSHYLIARAVKEGILVRPSKCEKCGKTCKPEGHHPDYNEPFKVKWLCHKCHSKITNYPGLWSKQFGLRQRCLLIDRFDT